MNINQQFIHLSKYARWRPNDNRRETWLESINRTLDYLLADVEAQTGYRLDAGTELKLFGAMESMDAFPSMRMFQMAGPAAARCNICNYNCSYCPIDSLSSFSEILYLLMQGTGVGFSVEQQYVDKLPNVRPTGSRKYAHTVEDTTEGWCLALFFGLECWFRGLEVEFDYSQVRPKGTRLATKGGWASGPGSLEELLAFVRGVISKYWVHGGRLTSLDCHDICCKIGEIVVVGGVRRSALLSLSDLDDVEMRAAKGGEFWLHSPWRAMSNNSAVYKERPTWKEFADEWKSLQDSGTGERGIWNRGGYSGVRPNRRDNAEWGVNPCGEIALRPRGLCNLSRAVCRPEDTIHTLEAKVRTAAIFGTLQSCLVRFQHLGGEWTRMAQEERLLGVSLDGAMDCALLRDDDLRMVGGVLEYLKSVAVRTNVEWASRLGIPRSAAVTTMQPGGNGAQLLGCSSGLHTRYAPYYIRRYRASTVDPLVEMLVDQGVPWNFDGDSNDKVVFDFPVASPAGCLTRGDVDALAQFKRWACFKEHWTEHNPSVTIYVKPEEWHQLGQAVYENWSIVGGLSFLPYDGGVYHLAPYEEIDKEAYDNLEFRVRSVDFSKLAEYEAGIDSTNFVGELSCVGGSCEL